MNESELLFSFFIGLSIVAVGAVFLSVLQWRRIDRELLIAKTMRRLNKKNQPAVTVLVYAHNQQAHIERTLRALKNNRYHAFDVVVVDDDSDDQTSQIVKQFSTRYPKAPIQLLRRRTQTTTNQALQAGYKKSQRGSIVMTVIPGAPIDALMIKRTVASQNERESWRVSMREGLGGQLRISDIGIFLEKYYWQQSERVHAYAAPAFKRQTAIAPTSAYADGITAAASILCFVFLLIAAFYVVGMQALWYGWIIVTAYGLVAVWVRYGESLRDRLVLTLSIPLALFLIPTTSLVRGISQLYSRK